jgi:AraC-like DNA-binding protein
MPSAAHPDPLASLPPLSRARVVGAYAKAALDTARELGADLASLGAACGLPGLADGLAEEIPARRYIALLEAAARQVADPFFGLHVGERMRLATFASYGLVLLTCRDFRMAAEQTLRFEGLAHDLGRSEVVASGGITHYRWHSPWTGEPGARHLFESVAAGAYLFVNWMAGMQVPLVEVAFTHPEPAGLPHDEYQRIFAAPIRFGAPVNGVRFPAEILDLPIPNADPSLFPSLARLAEQRLEARKREAHEPAILQAVRQRIQTELTHETARLPEVAAALGLTARTLQRQLAEAGVNFSALLDATRRDLAQDYLRAPGLSLTEIAFLLGFAEQSSFNHAFRAWFGTTPAKWRETHATRSSA